MSRTVRSCLRVLLVTRPGRVPSDRFVRAPLRALAVALLAGLALLVGAAPALAHAEFEGSDPSNGASLATGPQRVTIRFSDTMTPGFNTVTVIGPDGLAYQEGDVAAGGDAVSVAVRPLGPAGTYRIGYRVVSDDGHPVEGSVSFTLTVAGAGAGGPGTPAPAVPAAAVTGDPGGSAPIWPWIAGAIVAVGVGAVVAARRART